MNSKCGDGFGRIEENSRKSASVNFGLLLKGGGTFSKRQTKKCKRVTRISCFKYLNLREKIGCGDEPIYHLRYHHDFIDISYLTKQGISKKAAELYEKGFSTKAISNELGICKTAVNSRLNESGVELRSHSNKQLKANSSTKKKSIKTAPVV